MMEFCMSIQVLYKHVFPHSGPDPQISKIYVDSNAVILEWSLCEYASDYIQAKFNAQLLHSN